MRSTTAEIHAGPAQHDNFMGPGAGLNPTCTALLRENHSPAWVLLPAALYDTEPPDLTTRPVWIPASADTVLEDGILLVAALGLRQPQILAQVQARIPQLDRPRLNLAELDPADHAALLATCRRDLRGVHLVVNAYSRSMILPSLPTLGSYDIDLEVCTPQFTRYHHGDQHTDTGDLHYKRTER